MRSDIIDLEGCIHYATDLAIHFSTDGEKDGAVWLPKSMIECDYTTGPTVIQIGEQLAIDKGLI